MVVYFLTQYSVCHSEYGITEGKGAQVWEIMGIFQFCNGYYLRSHDENEPTKMLAGVAEKNMMAMIWRTDMRL